MTTHRTKLWLGLGSFLLAGTSTAALAFGPGGHAPNVTVLDLGAARSGAIEIAAGGEGGERGSVAGGANVRFLVALGEMEGHMDVGKRLFDQGQARMAQPHFHHPYLEVYESVKKDLAARGIQPFENTLKQLGAAGDTMDPGKIAHAYAEAKQAIAKARATMHPDVATSAKTQLQVAVALLAGAAHEYEEAVKDGKFDVIEEYQDGWGFVQVADRTIAGVAGALGKSWPGVHARVNKELAALKRAWPDPMPPKTPVLSVPDVHAGVARIEFIASQVDR